MPQFGNILVTYIKPTASEKACGIEGRFLLEGPVESFDLSFHAQRYVSAEMFEDAILDSFGAELDVTHVVCEIAPSSIEEIAAACLDDGADRGNIPCLGGDIASTWRWMLYHTVFILHPEKEAHVPFARSSSTGKEQGGIMRCQIQWIDEQGKPTPDNNEAVCYVTFRDITNDNVTEHRSFLCCAEHLKRMPRGKRFHAWGSTEWFGPSS